MRRFLIEDWDNFTYQEKTNVKELIAISLRAKEIRNELLNLQDAEDKDVIQPQDINSVDILANIISDGFEVTSNLDDDQAEPIGKSLPRVEAFIKLRPSILKMVKSDCEKACEAEFTDKRERDDCKKNCRSRINVLAEALLNSSSSIWT